MKSWVGVFATILAIGPAAGSLCAQNAHEVRPPALIGNSTAPILRDIEDTAQKLLELAHAMPADKFTWHPGGKGLPSVSELYLAVATHYYHRPRTWGAIKAAAYEYEGNDANAKRVLPPLEKSTTDKAQVILELTDSTSYFEGIMKTLPDADLQKPVKISGRETTPYADLLLMANDVHEYLARAIDYARMNDVVLPWMNQWQEEQLQRGARSPANQ